MRCPSVYSRSCCWKPLSHLRYSVCISLPKAPLKNPSRQQHETSANAETDDLARHPEHPDPVQRSSPSSNAHTVVEHLPPPSLSVAPGSEQASYASGDATPAQARIHEVLASINPEQEPVLSEAGHTPGPADGEQPPPAGTKRKRSLEWSWGMRKLALRENNGEAESGFDSGSSEEDNDREGHVLNTQHHLAQTSHKRHKGRQRVVSTKRFRSHSMPTDINTGSNIVDIQSVLHRKGSQSSTRITPIRRWGSCPSLNPSTSPSMAEDSLAGSVATFQEWPLSFVSLKRVLLGNGRATFQLQFDWDPNIDCEHPKRPGNNEHDTSVSGDGGQSNKDPDGDGEQRTRSRSNRPHALIPGESGQRDKVTPSRGFTSEENQFLIELKGQKNLRWSEITTEFNKNFLGRKRLQGCLQVHYSTKLKKRNAD